MRTDTGAMEAMDLANKDAIKNSADKRPVRVLLADTGELLREQLVTMLSDASYEVMTAVDGFEVLCRLPELRPDVLMIASDLPRLNGAQVCSLLRQSPDFAALPVLMLTGANAMIDKIRAEMAGANACLEKPFRSSELQSAFCVMLMQQTSSDRSGRSE